jgi:hypothetical protein
MRKGEVLKLTKTRRDVGLMVEQRSRDRERFMERGMVEKIPTKYPDEQSSKVQGKWIKSSLLFDSTFRIQTEVFVWTACIPYPAESWIVNRGPWTVDRES